MVSNFPAAASPSRQWLTDLFFLTALFAIFYTLWLGHYPLFTPDEGRYSEVAREMIATGDYITPRVNGIAFLDKPIFYYWLQALAMKWFGIHEWSVRFFPILISILGSLLTYICGRILFNRQSGVLAAIILATSPLYFGTAHYADLNLEVGVFISASLMLFITGITQRERNQKNGSMFLLAAYIFAAIAMLTKGLIGIVFPCLIAGSWIILLWRWKLLREVHLITGILLFLAIVLPWYWLAQKANPAFLHYFFVVQQFTRFLSGATFNNPTPRWFYLPIVLIGFFPWCIFLAQAMFSAIKQTWKHPQEQAVKLYLIVWVFCVLFFFSIPQSKTIGYIVPIFPALALLTGNYLSEQWRKPQQASIYISMILFVTFALILAALLLLLPHTHWLTFAPAFQWHLTVIAIIFITSAIISLLTWRQKNLRAYIIICSLCSVSFLLTLTLGAEHLNENSSKPISLYLKSVLKPQDMIVHFYNFFQDNAMYTGRNAVIVANWDDPTILEKDNWEREMWYGRSFQSLDNILISETDFWKYWNSSQHLYVMMDDKYLAHFKSQASHYYELQRFNDILLVSNQPAA